MDRTYLCIDLKSFYASVECVTRGLDPLTTNLVVADVGRTEKTIPECLPFFRGDILYFLRNGIYTIFFLLSAAASCIMVLHQSPTGKERKDNT